MELIFSYNHLKVAVKSQDEDDLAWLREFFCPAFQTVFSGQADYTISIERDDRKFKAIYRKGPERTGRSIASFALDTELVTHPIWVDDSSETTVYDDVHQLFYRLWPQENQIHLLSTIQETKQRNALMRVVRELFMIHGYSRNQVLMHGAALRVNGLGVLIAGPKKSGKTTLLVHLLNHEHARYLSNDRTLVCFEENGPVGYGMPTLISLRAPTLHLFPDLNRRATRSTYHPNKSMKEPTHGLRAPFGKDGRYRCNPGQFCKLVRALPTSKAGLGAILFPCVSAAQPGISLTRLPLEEAANRIERSLFRAGETQPHSELFLMNKPLALASQTPSAELCRQLAAQIPCLACALGPSAYTRSTDSLILLQEALSP